MGGHLSRARASVMQHHVVFSGSSPSTPDRSSGLNSPFGRAPLTSEAPDFTLTQLAVLRGMHRLNTPAISPAQDLEVSLKHVSVGGVTAAPAAERS